MSNDWHGDSNPGHKRRLKRWQAIEEEFGEPVANVIQGLREQGNSWRTVAGCLNVSLSVLLDWRHALGLPVSANSQKFDPSSYLGEKHPRHLDFRARELGYDDAVDAVLDLRLKRGMTIKQAAIVLGCHYATITRHTPRKIRGCIYNRSERWWRVRRAQCIAMTQMNRALRDVDKNAHIWSKKNKLIFQSVRGDNQ